MFCWGAGKVTETEPVFLGTSSFSQLHRPPARTKTLYVVFNPVPFIGAIVQIFNVWLYAILCPLKFRPLVCHVSASDVSTGAPPPPAADKRGAFHVNVSTRVFLRASAICMFLVGITCYYLNKWVLGDEAIHLFGFREHLRTAPGVVVVAVGTQACKAGRPAWQRPPEA